MQAKLANWPPARSRLPFLQSGLPQLLEQAQNLDASTPWPEELGISCCNGRKGQSAHGSSLRRSGRFFGHQLRHLPLLQGSLSKFKY